MTRVRSPLVLAFSLLLVACVGSDDTTSRDGGEGATPNGADDDDGGVDSGGDGSGSGGTNSPASSGGGNTGASSSGGTTGASSTGVGNTGVGNTGVGNTGVGNTGIGNTGGASGGDGGTSNDPPIFDPVIDYGAKGPFPTLNETSPADCLIYRPMVLGEKGRRHPVIVWGNGTGTPTATVYAGFFEQWASHGFIVAAANTPNAGTSKEMLACLDWVEAQDAIAGSPYEGHVARARAGASGHSQGGGGAIMAGRDPRVRTTIPFQPYTLGLGHDAASQAQQQGPMFMVSGSSDFIAVPAQNQAPVFAASNVPTFWGTLVGGDHVTIALGNVQAYLAPSTAWWLLQLANDENARAMFYGSACELCSDTTWQVMQKQL